MRLAALCLTVFLLSVTLNHSVVGATQNQPGLSVSETFDIYVRAVQNSDLVGLFSTVTDSERFFFLTATGELISTRTGYYRFHEDWFKEKKWEMPVELLEIHEGEEYGYAAAIFHYKSKTAKGGTYFLDSYFTLIFHKEGEMWKVVADVCTPISRHVSDIDSGTKYGTDQVYLFDVMKGRRTVRRFKPTSIPREHIMKILDAARFAPTAGNQQPWKFLVVQDREKLNQLGEQALSWYLEAYKSSRKPDQQEFDATRGVAKGMMENVMSAPVYVAVLVDRRARYAEYITYDGTLAAGYLMIAARALGYGTGFFTTYFPEEKMREFFDIPDQYQLICFTPVGVPEEWPETPPKRELEELVVFESF